MTPKYSFAAERALLLQFVRPRFDRMAVSEFSRPTLMWEWIVIMANQHKCASLAYQRVRGLKTIPPPELAAFYANARKNSAKSLCLAIKLIELATLFKTQDIPLLAFKGPTLALLAYRNLGARGFTDLDLLVPPERAEDAWNLLTTEGYKPKIPFSPRQRQFLYQYDNHCGFQLGSNASFVELHWRLCPSGWGIPMDGPPLWQRAVAVKLGQTAIQTLAPNDLLLYLCVHGTKHEWSRLSWLADIAWLIEMTPTLDWEELAARAVQLRMRRMLWLTLLLANDLLGIDAPAWLLETARADPIARRLATAWGARLFEPARVFAKGKTKLRLELALRERAVDRARYVFHWLFTPKLGDIQTADLPATLAWLYTPVRWFRLAARYALPAAQEKTKAACDN